MKTVKLSEKTFLKGRIREVGEVVLVEDNYKDETINKNIEKRNKLEVENFIRKPKEKNDEIKQTKPTNKI